MFGEPANTNAESDCHEHRGRDSERGGLRGLPCGHAVRSAWTGSSHSAPSDVVKSV